MAEPDKRPVTLEELLVARFAQTDALAKLLIEKRLSPQKSSYRRWEFGHDRETAYSHDYGHSRSRAGDEG